MVATPPALPPARQPGNVVRQRLLDRLTASPAAKLVLVVAPAGWGKTSLLRGWLAADDSCRAWLSVEAVHNDPARFGSAIIEAIGTISPKFGAAALEALAAAEGQPGRAERAVISQMARIPARVTLILDDFHLITSPETLECFRFLVEHLPPAVGLVVAARSGPALPLARLRARGEMTEIRAGDLSFSDAEATQLLNGTLGLDLPPAQVHALGQRTEGWAAGLHLAGLALRERKGGDRAGFASAFASYERYVADYLAAEVFGSLPPWIHSFMLRTCVLGRMCGSLCDAVTSSADSQGMLEEIERAQLFVVPLDDDRRWYRYHPLCAEALRGELDRSEPGLAGLLHRRASAWYRQQGLITEAISHALAAGDLFDARELTADHWDTILCQGQARVLQSSLRQLPPEMVAEDARMCLIGGFAAHHLDSTQQVEPWLAAAEAASLCGSLHHGPACVESGIAILQAACHHTAGDLAAAETAALRAAELELESGTAPWRAAALAMLGAALFWRGNHADAQALLERTTGSVDPPAAIPTRLLALGCLAAIAASRDDHDSARRHTREVTGLADRHGLTGHWTTVTADLTSAYLLADRGEHGQAGEKALRALSHAQCHQARPETVAALLCLASIHARAGRVTDARARVSQARDVIARCPAPGLLADLLADTEHLMVLPLSALSARSRTGRPDGLTAREAEVVQLLTRGYTNLEIAAALRVSVHTIERHLQSAYRKIGVRNRADAAAHMASICG
jgi:LuxR family transcriptional regulator, maltose regulon positive regulatory protein